MSPVRVRSPALFFLGRIPASTRSSARSRRLLTSRPPFRRRHRSAKTTAGSQAFVYELAQSTRACHRLPVDAEPDLLVHICIGAGRDLDAATAQSDAKLAAQPDRSTSRTQRRQNA